jgi:hypothetical protein
LTAAMGFVAASILAYLHTLPTIVRSKSNLVKRLAGATQSK